MLNFLLSVLHDFNNSVPTHLHQILSLDISSFGSSHFDNSAIKPQHIIVTINFQHILIRSWILNFLNSILHSFDNSTINPQHILIMDWRLNFLLSVLHHCNNSVPAHINQIYSLELSCFGSSHFDNSAIKPQHILDNGLNLELSAFNSFIIVTIQSQHILTRSRALNSLPCDLQILTRLLSFSCELSSFSYSQLWQFNTNSTLWLELTVFLFDLRDILLYSSACGRIWKHF